MNFLRRVWAWIAHIYSLVMSLPTWLAAGAIGVFGLVGGTVFAWNYFQTSVVVDYPTDFFQWLSVSRMSPETYNILVANLEDDTGNKQTRHVVYALEKGFRALDSQSPVQVQRAMRELKLHGRRMLPHLAKPRRKARAGSRTSMPTC